MIKIVPRLVSFRFKAAVRIALCFSYLRMKWARDVRLCVEAACGAKMWIFKNKKKVDLLICRGMLPLASTRALYRMVRYSYRGDTRAVVQNANSRKNTHWTVRWIVRYFTREKQKKSFEKNRNIMIFNAKQKTAVYVVRPLRRSDTASRMPKHNKKIKYVIVFRELTKSVSDWLTDSALHRSRIALNPFCIGFHCCYCGRVSNWVHW